MYDLIYILTSGRTIWSFGSLDCSRKLVSFLSTQTQSMVSFVTGAFLATNVVGAWNIYLTYRQEKAHRTNVIPNNAKAFVSEEDFAKTQAYSRAKLKYSLWHQVKELVENNVTLKCQVFPLLWYATQRWTGLPLGSLSHCIAFGAVTETINTAIELPWRYYYNFVLEEAYGFNRMTLLEFIKDTIKRFLLTVGVFNPINFVIVNFVVKRFGAQFPIYMFGIGSAVVFAAMYLVPVLIMPLFNKFTPLTEESSLFRETKKLADQLKFPLTKIYEVDGSRRSAHSNAYFYGFFNNKRIVLYDTLIKQMEEEEILAVLCHEFGHWYHNHTLANLGIGLGQLAAICFSARSVMFNAGMYSEFGFQRGDTTPIVGFSLFSAYFLPPVMEVVQAAMSALSRQFEFQADRFAIDMGYGHKLRSGLVKMQKENLASVTPDWLYASCRYSHPPLPTRLSAIDEELKKKE